MNIKSEYSEIDQADTRFVQLWEETTEYTSGDLKYQQSREWNIGALKRGEEIANRLAYFAGDLAGKRILDIGCGSGGIAIAFARKGGVCTALEPAPHRFEWAKVRTHDHGVTIELRKEGIEEFQCGHDGFDIILCVDVLEHIPNWRLAMNRLCTMLRPGGFIYCTTHNPFNLRHLWEEPHSGLAGVMLLPYGIRKWYVTRLRRVAKSYPVYAFPSLLSVMRIGRRYGLKLIFPDVLRKYGEPTLIGRKWMRRLIKIIHKVPLLRYLVKIFLCTFALGRGYCYFAQRIIRDNG